MDSDYGQFVYLDENNNFEDENIDDYIVMKNNNTCLERDIFLKKHFTDSMILMFLQYFCSLAEYFYEK